MTVICAHSNQRTEAVTVMKMLGNMRFSWLRKADCKSAYPGSIPGVASIIFLKITDLGRADCSERTTNAEHAGTKTGTPN